MNPTTIDSIMEKFDKEFDGETFDPEYWEHARDDVKSFFRKEIEELVKEVMNQTSIADAGVEVRDGNLTDVPIEIWEDMEKYRSAYIVAHDQVKLQFKKAGINLD